MSTHPELNPEAVEFAVKRLISEEDYDAYKEIDFNSQEDDPDPDISTWNDLVESFTDAYKEHLDWVEKGRPE